MDKKIRSWEKQAYSLWEVPQDENIPGIAPRGNLVE